ncbi:MAG: hypothetical protein KF779_12145 [Hyphomonadaceae bacterium]|nr:hypothetical protein [Hyphomonadaceae bacterium]
MSEARSFRETLAQSTYVHVAFGFLAMGAWAVFANRAHALPQALLAGLVQGTISGLLTLVLKKFLEWMSKRLSPALRQAQGDVGGDALPLEGRQPEPVEGGVGSIAALVLPPLITATAIATILITAHTLAGTPEVLATIAVPFTVSTTYAILYNLRLWRAAHGR